MYLPLKKKRERKNSCWNSLLAIPRTLRGANLIEYYIYMCKIFLRKNSITLDQTVRENWESFSSVRFNFANNRRNLINRRKISVRKAIRNMLQSRADIDVMFILRTCNWDGLEWKDKKRWACSLFVCLHASLKTSGSDRGFIDGTLCGEYLKV